MAAVAEKLSFAEFQLKFGSQDQSYEYWGGEAIQKAMPTWIHGALQAILTELLRRLHYKAGSEVELRIDPEYHPRPDVIATRGPMEIPYPTKAVEIVAEILSPEDPMEFVLEKCRHYQTWGFQAIYVLNPSARVVYEWIDNGLRPTEQLAEISVADIWTALDQELS